MSEADLGAWLNARVFTVVPTGADQEMEHVTSVTPPNSNAYDPKIAAEPDMTLMRKLDVLDDTETVPKGSPNAWHPRKHMMCAATTTEGALAVIGGSAPSERRHSSWYLLEMVSNSLLIDSLSSQPDGTTVVPTARATRMSPAAVPVGIEAVVLPLGSAIPNLIYVEPLPMYVTDTPFPHW